ncbi:MAG: hypothetical protein ACK5NF_00765 [Bacilli bacterium]
MFYLIYILNITIILAIVEKHILEQNNSFFKMISFLPSKMLIIGLSKIVMFKEKYYILLIFIINIILIFYDRSYSINILLIVIILLFHAYCITRYKLCDKLILYSILIIYPAALHFWGFKIIITIIFFGMIIIEYLYIVINRKFSLIQYEQNYYAYNNSYSNSSIILLFVVLILGVVQNKLRIEYLNLELFLGYYVIYKIFQIELQFLESSQKIIKKLRQRVNLSLLYKKRVSYKVFYFSSLKDIFHEIVIIFLVFVFFGIVNNNILGYITTILMLIMYITFIFDVIIRHNILGNSIVYANSVVKKFIEITFSFIAFITILTIVINNGIKNIDTTILNDQARNGINELLKYEQYFYLLISSMAICFSLLFLSRLKVKDSGVKYDKNY